MNDGKVHWRGNFPAVVTPFTREGAIDEAKFVLNLETLVSERYMREIPLDPITRERNWITQPAPPDPSDPNAGAGVYEIRSASDRTGLNGTRYNTW